MDGNSGMERYGIKGGKEEMKIRRLALSLMAFTLIGSFAAFAGSWKKGVSRPNDWWFDNEDGTYPHDGWAWLDGNKDNIAECYYFDKDGWMLANTKTPDGYLVNEGGAWVVDGKVQTKEVPKQKTDVKVGGYDVVQRGNSSGSRGGGGGSSSGGGSGSGSGSGGGSRQATPSNLS